MAGATARNLTWPTTQSNDSVVDQTALPKHGFLSRLYTGTGAFEIVGRRKFYYALTGAIVLISLLSIVFRGFTLGIDFEGGSKIQLPAVDGVSTTQVEDVYAETIGADPVSVQTVGSGRGEIVRDPLGSAGQRAGQQTDRRAVRQVPAEGQEDGNPSRNEISNSDVSETWNNQITKKALIALGVFLVLVTLYIAIRFERDMALAALAALFFDMSVTAGVYSIVGFEMTLGDDHRLADDPRFLAVRLRRRVRQGRGEHARCASDEADLCRASEPRDQPDPDAIDQYDSHRRAAGYRIDRDCAVWLLGVGTLKDLALVQLVGMIVGAYSSIFFATPLLVSIKELGSSGCTHQEGARSSGDRRDDDADSRGRIPGVSTVKATPIAPHTETGGQTYGKAAKEEALTCAFR